jgi:4-aminobutyrate aminotransferase/(S)-3-amino-2-methylpropionate transaminase
MATAFRRSREGRRDDKNVGPSDEGVLGAGREQLERLVHIDYTVAPYGIYAGVAERLVGIIEGAGKAAFFNSGAEAVENSIKMARVYTGRQAVIFFEGATGEPRWRSRWLARQARTRAASCPSH